MLSRIRNANLAGFEKVSVPFTKINFCIAKILKEEGFVDSFDCFDNLIFIKLKFKKGSKRKSYISFIKRVSKPGLRVYVNVNNIPKILGGIGVAIFSVVFFCCIFLLIIIFNFFNLNNNLYFTQFLICF